MDPLEAVDFVFGKKELGRTENGGLQITTFGSIMQQIYGFRKGQKEKKFDKEK